MNNIKKFISLRLKAGRAGNPIIHFDKKQLRNFWRFNHKNFNIYIERKTRDSLPLKLKLDTIYRVNNILDKMLSGVWLIILEDKKTGEVKSFSFLYINKNNILGD